MDERRVSDEDVETYILNASGYAGETFCEDWSCESIHDLASDLKTCRAEAGALRERAERAAAESRGFLAENIRQAETLAEIKEELHRQLDVYKARVALLEGLLREVEWATAENDEGEYEFCPSCRYFWDEHRDDCRLAAALTQPA